jgi:hypothetical protein
VTTTTDTPVGPELITTEEGAGPLLQRDYWGVIAGCKLTPPEIATLLTTNFPDFPPAELVRFRRSDEGDRPLEPGDLMEVEILLAGSCRVQVLRRDENSITLGTLAGHPEAGRITFGAYPNQVGDVVFHIRSRARSSSKRCLIGYLAAGEAMQTNTWTDFINNLAATAGQGVVGAIRAETSQLDADDDEPTAPTFVAVGG